MFGNDLALDVQNLSKVYEFPAGRVVALNRVSFSIRQDEFVSIVGPSGSGKSTLLNLLVLWTDTRWAEST